METNAQRILRAYAARDFSAWPGLAAETSLADMATICELDLQNRFPAPLGEALRPAEWLSATCADYEMGSRVWVEPGKDRVVLVDTEYPNLAADVNALLKQL